MNELLEYYVSQCNRVLAGFILVPLLLGAGLFFTWRLRGIQVRMFFRSVREMFRGVKAEHEGDISPFQAFATGLASRVGTGNIVGVAVAIGLGGPGAIFWMWMTALVGMASSLVECTLAQVYKVRHHDGTFRGGPAYYIQLGLGKKWLSVLFAVSMLLAFGFVFNAIQANSIADVMKSTYGMPPWIMGLILLALSAVVVCGGVRTIGRVAGYMVPVMAIAYFLLAAFIVMRNLPEVPGVLALIVRSAFGLEPAVGGVAGYTILQALNMGVRRGLFSNEAGMGSAPNAAAMAAARHPANQGFLQMLGVFVDTMVVCTCTACVILLTGVFEPGSGVEGVALTQSALTTELGWFGHHFLAIAMFFFAFSSVIGNYAYAEGNVELLQKNPAAIWVFRALVLVTVYLGSVASVPLVWKLGDLSQSLMAVINLVAILWLAPLAVKVIQDYMTRLKPGEAPPRFDRHTVPEIEGRLPRDVW